MSLNIGTPAVEAAKRLNGNPDWQVVRDGLREQMRAQMNRALDGDPSRLHDAAGYARALRDLWLAFESASTGTPMNQVQKPGPEKK